MPSNDPFYLVKDDIQASVSIPLVAFPAIILLSLSILQMMVSQCHLKLAIVKAGNALCSSIRHRQSTCSGKMLGREVPNANGCKER